MSTVPPTRKEIETIAHNMIQLVLAECQDDTTAATAALFIAAASMAKIHVRRHVCDRKFMIEIAESARDYVAGQTPIFPLASNLH